MSDRAALALLAERGIDEGQLTRLDELAATALGAQNDAVVVQPADAEEARLQALIDLRRWSDDWSETTRAVIKRNRGGGGNGPERDR